MDKITDPLEAIKALNRHPFRTWSPNGYHLYQYELDKIRGWWLITHWPSERDGLALRLKVQEPSGDGPNCPYVCEIRPKAGVEFLEIGEGLRLDLLSIDLCLDEPEAVDVNAAEIYASFPAGWRSEFWQMARRFTVIWRCIAFGSNFVERYAGEPNTSRDFQQMFERLLELEAEHGDRRAKSSQDEAD